MNLSGCRTLLPLRTFSQRGPKRRDVLRKVAGALTEQHEELAVLLSRESGKPILVTEWYAKGMDSGMANQGGAGWVVKTQRDRGLLGRIVG